MRYFLQLSYNGSAFHGWQSQPNAVSVQETVEKAISTVARRPVAVTGAGRTDAGVHARRMFAHFDLEDEIREKGKFLLSLDRLCGRDVAFHDLVEVSPEAHARFDATERTYKYLVIFHKSPFLSGLAWHSPSRLDTEKMNEAAAILTDTSDFTSFAKLHSDAKTNICDVRNALWTPLSDSGKSGFSIPGEGIVFTISADRFLRNMVRAVVGTLVEVGRGKITVNDFREIIERKDRCAAGTSMPPGGLYLWDIKYPFITTPVDSF